MIPFGSYLLAEHLHCSGILAAVASGLAMGPSETAGEVGAITGIRRTTIWDTIQFAANGIIFVLLGEQLPELLSGAVAIVQSIGHRDPWWLALYVVAINVGLAVLRFLWVWLSFSLTLFRQGHWRRVPNWRIVAAMSFCGVRGATTLAGVLTLPLAMSDGSAFPSRELAIFLAMGVIITSLIVASIDLPLLLRGLSLPPEPSHLAKENAVRIAAAEAAVAAVQRAEHAMAEGRADADLYVAAASRVMDLYRQRIELRQSSTDEAVSRDRLERIKRELRMIALRAERAEILRWAQNLQIGSEAAIKMVRETDLMEARYI